MKKISKLTTAQTKKMAEYVKIWTEKGLTTNQKSHYDAVRDFTAFQKHVLKMENPAPVVLLNSPNECWMAIMIASTLSGCDVNQVLSQVQSQVLSQVSSQIESQVRSQVLSQVRSQVGSQKIIYPYFDCQYWASWFSFYEFARNELTISFTNSIEYESFLNCHSYGMVWPLKNLCVVCQPPTVINKNSSGLHCENGPALSYNGQNEIYALNGVTMPKELVLTSSEDLSIDFFKNEKNADVKAEFVRKFGIERMLDMGKLLDTFENYPNQKDYDWWWKSQYELYDMSKCFADIPYQPYLKMMNQTTKIWHMEAVSPNCRTLKDAIKERFGGKEMKIVAIA